MSKKDDNITIGKIATGKGPEFILLNKCNGVYKTWTTSEKFTELLDILISQTPEEYRIKLANDILQNNI